MLDYSEGERERVRTSQAVFHSEGGCDDLRQPWPPIEPNTRGVCEECIRAGTQWVHLRLCLTCGNVGCCDSSPQRHATAHFHESLHPVMQSAEPGETWRWCFVHELTG
jgi:hypothetical protein